MPASVFAEMESPGDSFHDHRALQLALELSILDLATTDNDIAGTVNGYESESRSKKSQNTTECVPVPSSEHVAEIVGRQGCKIKALRAKTNTYIKTPVRNEEPVFVVTGRKDDVTAAKREILSAAEHFSQIRAQRKNNMNGSLIPGPNSNIPGQRTIQVRVPYRVVGLVVGPKGATIKRIQQQTNTYIVTPSRDKEPVFEVTGMPDNVENARKEIEAHIAMRTGGALDSPDSNDFHISGLDHTFAANVNATNGFINSASELNSGFNYDSNNIVSAHSPDTLYHFTSSSGSVKITDIYSSPSIFPGSFTNGYSMYDVETEGESHVFDSSVISSPSTVWSEYDNSASLFSTAASTNTSTTFTTPSHHCTALTQDESSTDIHTDPLNSSISSFPAISNGSTTEITITSFPRNSSGSSDSVASSPTDIVRKIKRDCVVCYESEIVAALVPCGHNMFCLECANRICEKPGSECPVCRQLASQAIRIYS